MVSSQGRAVGPPEAGEMLEGLHQQLLDHILGIGSTARQPAGEAIGLVQMGHHHMREIRLLDHRPSCRSLLP